MEGGLAGGELDDGDGVGGVGEEFALIDVEADADDGFVDVCAGDCVLDKDAADLAVADVDVVGPLDVDGIVDTVTAQFFLDGLGDGEGDGLGDAELSRGVDACGAQDDAEGQVESGPGLPGVAALSASGGLLACGHDETVRRLGIEYRRVGVCRRAGVPPDYHTPEMGSVELGEGDGARAVLVGDDVDADSVPGHQVDNLVGPLDET